MKKCVIVVLSLLLFGCHDAGSNANEPKINPKPKVFFTLHGHVAPQLRGKLFITFMQTYVSTNFKNKHCWHVDNPLAGGKNSYSKIDYYPLKPDAEGNYEIKIPLDKYEAGVCEWRANQTYYAMSKSHDDPESTGRMSLASVSNDNHEKNPTVYNLKCRDSKGRCKVSVNNGKYMFVELRKGQSYKLKFNVIVKK